MVYTIATQTVVFLADFQQPELTGLSDIVTEGDVEIARCTVPQMRPIHGKT